MRAGCCEITYGEYRTGAWRSLLEPAAARLPGANGDIYLGANFDVNARGDILFQAFGSFGQGLVLHASGRTRLVASALSLMDDGVILEEFSRLDLRDDGSFYFQAIDADDVTTLYHAAAPGRAPAQPTPVLPPRLRARSLPTP